MRELCSGYSSRPLGVRALSTNVSIKMKEKLGNKPNLPN